MSVPDYQQIMLPLVWSTNHNQEHTRVRAAQGVVLVAQISRMNKSIAPLVETIGRQSQKLQGHKSLTSTKGIGELSVRILLSIVGDSSDFADEGKLAPYFCIVPRITNSNESELSGCMRGEARSWGEPSCKALLASRHSPYLKTHYDKKKSRRTGKEIIELAGKFLRSSTNTDRARTSGYLKISSTSDTTA